MLATNDNHNAESNLETGKMSFLNSRVLKIIAVVSMAIDHTGVVLFPESDWLRIVGRLAMPIFCFLLAFGCTKTRSIRNFTIRLAVLAVASQIIYNLALYDTLWQISDLNVFFTLAAGVGVCGLMKWGFFDNVAMLEKLLNIRKMVLATRVYCGVGNVSSSSFQLQRRWGASHCVLLFSVYPLC